MIKVQATAEASERQACFLKASAITLTVTRPLDAKYKLQTAQHGCCPVYGKQRIRCDSIGAPAATSAESVYASLRPLVLLAFPIARTDHICVFVLSKMGC